MDKEDSYKVVNLVSNGNTTVMQLHQQMMKVRIGYWLVHTVSCILDIIYGLTLVE